MNKRIFFILPLLVFMGIAGYFAFGLIAAQERGTRIIPDAMVGKPVPEFNLPSFNAEFPALAASDLKGKVQVVNFFASWCIPCLAEHPMITKIVEKDGVIVNGIGYSDSPENIANWLRKHGNPYARVGVDQTRRIGIDWGVSGVPETFVIDKNGQIVFKHGGPLTQQVIDEDILPLIKELEG